jgi:WD40 repeat protein
MYKTIFTLILLSSTLYSRDIFPVATIEASGLVSDFVEDNGFLYVATDAGSVDIIDLSTQKIVDKITIAALKTVRDVLVPARIHSVDRSKGKTLFVSSGKSGYRNVWLHDGAELKKVVDEKQRMMPKRAFFTIDEKIVFGTFGSDVILYDDKEGYKLYDSHISESTMGGMVLSQDKKKMVIADESGTVRLLDIKSSKVEKVFSSEHVDNIYRVAYNNGLIITAGQDRRVGVYPLNGQAYHIKSDFLVYCVGLSPSAATGVYSSGTEHHLQLFNTHTGNRTDRLIGHFATPNKIMFINEDSLISAGDENTIYFWLLDK